MYGWNSEGLDKDQGGYFYPPGAERHKRIVLQGDIFTNVQRSSRLGQLCSITVHH